MESLSEAAESGDTNILDEAFENGLISDANANDLFRGALEKGGLPATARWFLNHFIYDQQEGQQLVYKMAIVSSPETVAILARRLPLGQEGLRNLLIVLLSSLEDKDLDVLDAWIEEDLMESDTPPREQYPFLRVVTEEMGAGRGAGAAEPLVAEETLRLMDRHFKILGWFVHNFAKSFGWDEVEGVVENWAYVTFDMLQNLARRYAST